MAAMMDDRNNRLDYFRVAICVCQSEFSCETFLVFPLAGSFSCRSNSFFTRQVLHEDWF